MAFHNLFAQKCYAQWLHKPPFLQEPMTTRPNFNSGKIPLCDFYEVIYVRKHILKIESRSPSPSYQEDIF